MSRRSRAGEAALRLLNAAHSTMAYVGLASGLNQVHEAIGLPPIRALVERLWDEAVETMTPTAGLDTVDYCEALIERFGNPGLAHRLLQIAEDGSRKLPEPILRPLEERTVNDRASPAMVFALAAWLTCVEQGTAPLVDPNLAKLREKLRGDGFAAMGHAGMISDPAWVYPPLRPRSGADQRKHPRAGHGGGAGGAAERLVLEDRHHARPARRGAFDLHRKAGDLEAVRRASEARLASFSICQ